MIGGSSNHMVGGIKLNPSAVRRHVPGINYTVLYAKRGAQLARMDFVCKQTLNDITSLGNARKSFDIIRVLAVPKDVVPLSAQLELMQLFLIVRYMAQTRMLTQVQMGQLLFELANMTAKPLA